MIRFESVSAAPASAVLLRDLTFEFAPGESHLILGANGSGKTTLLRVLAGLLAPTSGRVWMDGKPVPDPGDGHSLWPDLAILFEEPDPQFLTDRVEAEVSFGLESLALPSEEIRARAAETIGLLGLRGMEERNLQSLSAGEKARTLLAAVLAGRPRALALDQSLAHLDPASRREIESGLVKAALAGERVVVRTHQDADPPFPGERVWVIHGGGLTDVGGWSPEAVLEADHIPIPLAMRVSALLARHGLWSGPLALDAASLGNARVNGVGSAPRAGETTASREQIEMDWLPEAPARESSPPTSGRIVLALDRVRWTAPRARHPVLSDVALEVHEGEVIALIGASGSGKTTLLKLTAGLLSPTGGTIRKGMWIERGDRSERQPIPLALEFPERQLFGRTVAEDVAAGLWVRGIGARERAERANGALSAVGLDAAQFAERVPSSLSEGEKRRAALAGFLVNPAPVLLLDEPTAGLDPEGRRAIRAMLRRLAAEGTAVLFASHDYDFVLGVADRAIVIGRDADGSGRIVAESRPSLLWQDPSTLTGVPGPAADAITIGAVLRQLGYIRSKDLRDSDSVLEALTRSLASGGRDPRGRVPAPSEATSARG